jgi:hypothetical protein
MIEWWRVVAIVAACRAVEYIAQWAVNWWLERPLRKKWDELCRLAHEERLKKVAAEREKVRNGDA